MKRHSKSSYNTTSFVPGNKKKKYCNLLPARLRDGPLKPAECSHDGYIIIKKNSQSQSMVFVFGVFVFVTTHSTMRRLCCSRVTYIV